MLVLSRKSRESVVIGGADGFHRLLKVTVLDIRGTNVSLGFEVDPSIPVHRSEVWERIHGKGNGNGNGQGSASLMEDRAVLPLSDVLSPLGNRIKQRGSPNS